MKKRIVFFAYCLLIGFTAALTVVTGACTSTPGSAPASSAPAGSTTQTSTSSSAAIALTSPANTATQPLPSATSQSGASRVLVNMPSFADLLTVVESSVVEIDTSGTVTTGRGRRTVLQQGAGSGWIIDANGTIVTNNHVTAGATTITVTTFDGKTFPAQVINADAVNDLALVKINATQLTSINVGDASRLRTGDWVLAIGNPLGQGIIATQGIVSRLGVTVPVSSTQTYNDLIETTAPINPGNSGGPLVNMAGEVVGITTLGATGVQGMFYAISMVDALPAIQKLLGK